MQKIVTGEEKAKLFLDNIYRIHGFPNDIVSDKGLSLNPIFAEDFLSYLV
jgi:hypothetical protein